MHIAILGRQPAISMAELEQQFGSTSVRWFSDTTALVDSPQFDFERLGGTQKAGAVVAELSGEWHKVSAEIVKAYTEAWSTTDFKITLGISAYGFNASAREIQKTGIILKSRLKDKNVSLRLIPNTDTALNTATSHHNKLGQSRNKVELLVVRASTGKVIVAESVGTQNITALAKRDQGRPKRDAFVGMLPPKLARIMVNLLGPLQPSATILDPFCGTGVLLQEASLLGFSTYGTDLAEKMIEYSRENLTWLDHTHHLDTPEPRLEVGDAMKIIWHQPIDAVTCETYLGQPFSAPPSPAKLTQVRDNCNHIISDFLTNLAPQLKSGTPICLAVPAWRQVNGNFTHLPFIQNIESFGFERVPLSTIRDEQLLYYREDQVVARELLILKKRNPRAA